MTGIVFANSIAAAIVICGLAAVMHFGHLTAGGRFERVLWRFELHRGGAAADESELRRAA